MLKELQTINLLDTSLLHNKYSYRIYDCIRTVPTAAWNIATAEGSMYLSYAYLNAYQDSMCASTEFRYVLFYDINGLAVVACVFQKLRFSLQELLQKKITSKPLIFIASLLTASRQVSFLMCGNLFISGETGFAHHSSISKKTTLFLLDNLVQNPLRTKIFNTAFSFVVFKEFWPTSSTVFPILKNLNYHRFAIDKNMLLAIPSQWNTFEGYMRTMKTKYRTRAKSVLKKASEIHSRKLDSQEIEAYLPEIDVLYHNVLAKSHYNLGALKAGTFLNFKKELQEKFVFTGYFHNAILVGFSAAFIDTYFVDANFVGVNYDFVTSHKLYQRILYDFIGFAIDTGSKELRLGRTAETIKSGVGAVPISMYLFAKHSNRFKNILVQFVVRYITPESPQIRKPFKNNEWIH